MDNKRAGIQEFLQARLKNVTDAMGSVDDAYAKRIRENVGGLSDDNIHEFHEMGMADKTRATMGQLLGVKRSDTLFDREDPRYNQWLDDGLKHSLVASRYAIPAAGVTAAGAGLLKLSESFGGPADSQSPQQIQI